MSAVGVYQPGGSVLHRAPAGLKLAVLVAAGAGLVLLDSPAALAGALVGALALYAVAGLGPRVAWSQARPLAWVLVGFGLLQWWLAGGAAALRLVLTISTLVLVAGVVSATTRTTALVDALVALLRPLRPLGVDPERVALLLALSVRAVPVVAGLAGEVREAQRARGVRFDVRTFGAPFLIRSLRHADALGEALRARGVDD